jgi:hypothetical protein
MPEDTRSLRIQLRQQAAFFWTLKLISEEISTGLPWMQLIEGSSRRRMTAGNGSSSPTIGTRRTMSSSPTARSEAHRFLDKKTRVLCQE